MGFRMGKLIKDIETHLAVADQADILEIGMNRGEGSTDFFIDYAQRRGVRFVGVDMMINREMQAVTDNPPEHCDFYITTGEDYLQIAKLTDRKFSIVYLDNYDWNYWGASENGLIRNQRKIYEKHHPESEPFDNVHSQMAHLNQAIGLTDMLTPNSVVICDDTWFDQTNQIYLGKCGAAIPYLISIGFEVTYTHGQGTNGSTILTRQNI